MLKLPPAPPPVWPTFTSRVRSTALTARLGRMVGICFAICFVTGLLSHYQYQPWSWLPEPASPVWLYRATQGLHVITGIATIPLLLVKLWSVYPSLFRWPPVTSLRHAAERLSVAVLLSSALVELFTGFFNAMDWYPWSWSFVPVHRFLAYVVIGSILLHIAVKLPDIKRGLATPLARDGVLTEIETGAAGEPAGTDEPGAADEPAADVEPSGLSRRGLLVATGVGVGVVVATTVGQVVTPLEPIGLLTIRQQRKGPQRVPVNKTAAQAGVTGSARSSTWALDVVGPQPFTMTVAEVEDLATHEEHLPISCVEGWSVGAQWRGVPLIELVSRAGGNADSRVRVVSLQQSGSYNHSYVDGPQLTRALLATHLNGERLDLDHGYPLRLISPDRAGVLNTKWLRRIEVS